MKITPWAVFALSLYAATAHAQSSVTVWGNIDTGVMYAKLPKGSTTAVTDGQLYPSEFGFKGNEDLGGGQIVGFALTGGFDSRNGSQDASNAPGSFFGREAKITLGGKWGTVSAGLQFDPALLSSILTEPRGLADTFSMLLPAVIASFPILPVHNSPGGSGGAFDANSVGYSFIGGGFYLGALHEFGGQTNKNSALYGNAIGLNYSKYGFSASYGYTTLNNSTGGTSSEISIAGLGYAQGAFAVRIQVGRYKTGYGMFSQATPASDVKAWGVGFDWKTAELNKLNLSYYDMKDGGIIGGGGTRTLVLMDTYLISKRTTLYAQIAAIRADNNPGLTNIEIYAPSGTGTAGGRTTAIGFGINHYF